MARKRRSDEVNFGTDSFLDVVCNIVGILIILIVVVGVRVQQTAPGLAASVVPAPASSLPEEPPADLPPLPEFAPLPDVAPPPELVQKAQTLQRDGQTLQAQLQQADDERQRVAQLHHEQTSAAELLRSDVSARAQALRGDRDRLVSAQAQLALMQEDIAGLTRQVSSVNTEGPPVEKLTHHLPPIGRVVTGNEIHFRLLNGRVSRVPLNQLASEVQHEIERRKDILLTRNFFQGTTQPIDGYVMEYVLQRQAMTLQDEMRMGRGVIRIGVSGWVIRPGGQLVTENADQALQPGSAFQQALAQEGPSATVTFWVYPDSFEIHRQLKAFAHDAGYWVASRPLPDGVPIAGSPQGSKSHAQ